MTGAAMECHLCGSSSVKAVPGFKKFRRITSDCRPWKEGGQLVVCLNCGGVQKTVDDKWRREATEIYGQYQVYHQGGGCEQSVFIPRKTADDGANDTPAQARSQRLVGRLGETFELPAQGRMLDIGCGNGSFLRAFSAAWPHWTLAGSELDGRHKEDIEGIAGVQGLYTCPIEEIPGQFDLISLVHCLEHIPNPQTFLAKLKAKLAPGGRLFVQVPCFSLNPFDLLIADHCTHFTVDTLERLFVENGFQLSGSISQWVPKELSLVVRPGESPVAVSAPPGPDGQGAFNQASGALNWLEALLALVTSAASEGEIGVFGTSIAAGWLGGQLEEVKFFVDEDSNRVGGTFLDRPVYGPDQIPENSGVFIALAWPICGDIAHRLETMGIGALLPPQMDD